MKGSTARAFVLLALIFSVLLWLLNERGHCGFSMSTETRIKTDILSLERSVAFYRRDFGAFPSRWSGLIEADPAYLEGIPLDPWGLEYRLEVDPFGTRFRIGCYGRDGEPGGKGSDEDYFAGWVSR